MLDELFHNPPAAHDFGDCRPLSHTADPVSSHEAIESLTKSGRRDRHLDIVEEQLRQGSIMRLGTAMTAAELAQRMWSSGRSIGLDVTANLVAVRKRLTDLLGAGRVVQSGQRMCRVLGRATVTWRANENRKAVADAER